MAYLKQTSLVKALTIAIFSISTLGIHSIDNPFILISQNDGDADNDGILDFVDADSDNDGILDIDENVICETLDLSDFNGNMDALNTFNNAMITVGGLNGALIQIESPLEINGASSIDEFIISNEHVIDNGTSDSTSLLLGVQHGQDAAGNNLTGLANSLGTNYTFSKPVCDFNFNLYDIDRTDEVLINGTLNGVTIPFSVIEIGNCLNYNQAASTINSECDTQANPASGNVNQHYAVIQFDGCIDRLEFDLYDFDDGNGGSFTFLPAPEPICVGLDTDLDGIPDFIDLDSDNDGIPDAIEACSDITLTLEDCTLDNNGDGAYVMNAGENTGELVDRCSTSPVDTDGDGIPDFLDLDSDGDGCPDATEAVTNSNPNVTDTDVSDGYMDPAAGVNDCGLVFLADGMTTECPFPPSSNWVDNTIDACQASISLVKTGVLDVGADGVPTPNDVINYTFEVCNTGMADIMNITVADPLVTISGGPISLAAMSCDQMTFTGTYSITQTNINDEGVDNTAMVVGQDLGGNDVTDTADETVPIALASSIEITKTGTFNDENGNGVSDVGETISYVFIVTNTGNTPLMNIAINDPILTVSGGPVTLAVGQVDNSTFTGTYSITQTDITNMMVDNTATVTGVDPAGNTSMDTDDESIPLIAGTPSISLLKTGTFEDENGDGLAQPGETISYDFTVENTGNLDLNNVIINDPLITVQGGPANLVIGQVNSITFTGEYTLTVNDLVNQFVVNEATVSGMTSTGETVTDMSMENIPFTSGTSDIMLTKTGSLMDMNLDGLAQAGETIIYQFTVTNTGAQELTNVTVTDPVLTVNGGPISLQIGAANSTTFTGSYVLSQDDVDSGSFMNTATTLGTSPFGEIITDMDDEDINLPQQASISIVKTGMLMDENNNGISEVGETISYIFIVTNTGNTTLTNVTVVDPLVDVIGDPMTLAPGDIDNTSYTGIYVLTQADIDNGFVNNVASTSGVDPNSLSVTDTDDEQTPLNLAPEIRLLKEGTLNDSNGDGFAQVGETITYTFTVINSGNVTVTNIMLTDAIITLTGGPIMSMAPGDVDNTTFSGVYVLTQADIDAGGVLNSAVAAGSDPDGNPVDDISDDPQNPQDIDPDDDGEPDDPTFTNTPQMPAIDLLKEGTFTDENSDGFGQPGETITYQFTVTNIGNVTLTDISVSDPLITVIGDTIGSLAPQQSDGTSYTGTYTIQQSDIDAGKFENIALASGTDPSGMPTEDMSDDPQNPMDVDPDEDGNPDDPTIIPVGQTPKISLLKEGSFKDENQDGLGQPGETIDYTFTVINIGNVTLTEVTITDSLIMVIGGPLAILLPGQSNSSTFSGSYTLTQSDIDAGFFENVALATGLDPDGITTEDTSDDPQNPQDDDPDDDGEPDDPTIIPVGQNPEISLLKLGTFNDENQDGFGQPGETISYSFTVTNTGNVTLSNVIITDPLINVSGGPINSLDPGQVDTNTFTGSYTITLADIDNGGFENIALATGTDPQGVMTEDMSDDPQNPTDDDPDEDGNPDDPTIIPIGQNPKISVLKIGSFQDENGDGFAQPGESITYGFEVTNIGNVSLTDVTITDELVDVEGTPIPLLEPGDSNSTNFVAVYFITQDDIDSGGVLNSALATGIDPNGDPTTDISDDPQNPEDDDPNEDGDPDDPTIIPVPVDPQISLLKTGIFNDENNDGFGQPGETINYVFTVENTGNVTLTNITISDPLVTIQGGPIDTLSPGVIDNTTFTATYTITQDDIDAGEVENLATATGTDPDGETVEDDSDDPQNPTNDDPNDDGEPDDPTTIPVGQNPLIEILKTGTFQDENGDGFADIGETILYQFLVTNTGNVTLTDITLEDQLVFVSSGIISSLAPGETDDSKSGIYSLTENDLKNLSIENTAIAAGQDPNDEIVMDISDDPNDPEDVDPEGDGEPDDPTVVPYCGIVLDVVSGPRFQCLDLDEPIEAQSDNNSIIPNGFELIYVLTSEPGKIIEQVSTSPDNFIVDEVGVYNIHPFILEMDDPQDPNFVDLSIVAFGVTPAIDVFNLIRAQNICADLDLNGFQVDIAVCNINLEKEQVFEELFEDEDVAITFSLTITNNGEFDIRDLQLTDNVVFLPAANPVTPLNDSNMEVTITNVDAAQTPTLNPDFNGVNDLNIFDGMSGFLRPGESFVVTFRTELSVFKFREAFSSTQFNQATVTGTKVDPNGTPIEEISDFSDDPTVLTDVDIDEDGDPDDPTPIAIPICDELVCNNNLVFSLNQDCHLVVTPDMLLENPSPLGNYTIEFFNPQGEPIGNVLTEEFVFVRLLFNLDCSQGSCWGNATIEANNTPDFDAPCELNEDGSIPNDCIIWCDPGYYPSIIVSPTEVEEAFGDCGPDLLSLYVDETRSGNICDPMGEIVTLTYSGKVERHGRIETVDILTQKYAIQKINIDVDENGINAIFSFPESVIIDCDAKPDEDLDIDPDIEIYSPEYISYLIAGHDAFPFYYDIHEIVADTMIDRDTAQVVDISHKGIPRDTMVEQDIDGDNIPEWVVVKVIDKPMIDSISIDTIINNFAHPKVPVFDINCNTASSYADIEYEACGNGRKIVREWTILDWCDADIFISGVQTIEIIDQTDPQVVKEIDGELVPITMLDDVMTYIEPWSCSANYTLPELHIIDNCDTSTVVIWNPEDGVVKDGVISDLWYEQSPIKVVASIIDDCENQTDISFNIIIRDDTPPVAVCESSLTASLTHSQIGIDGTAKIYAADIDEGSHDSDCGKVKISVVRQDDWTDVVRDCQDRIVGYKPVSCSPHTHDIDLGEIDKNDCKTTGENLAKITAPGEFVTVCCEDFGQLIPVILIVEDEQGNVNLCLTQINVVDESAPTILCIDQEVKCTDGDQLLIPAMVGSACPGETPLEVELLGESRSNNVCAGGEVVREWFIDIDHSGDFNAGDPYCSQIVSVESDDGFDPYSIKWPKHYNGDSIDGVNVECNEEGKLVQTEKMITMGSYSACVPDEVVDIPVWCDTNCGLVGYTMKSDTIKASDACLKIIRRWTIVDWCLYSPNESNIDDENDSASDSFEAVEDWAQGQCASCPDYGPAIGDPVYFRYESVENDGYYTFDQVIVVNDDSRPELDVASEHIVNTSSGDFKNDDGEEDCIGSDILYAEASDFCGGSMTGANLLQWQIYVRNGDEIVDSKTVRGPEASMMTPEGQPGDQYSIQWIVRDGCGNETAKRTEVMYQDMSAPTPLCISSLTTSFTGTDGASVIWAKEFEFGSADNCTAYEDLRYSIVTPDQNVIQPNDPNFDTQTSISYDCSAGTNFAELQVWVWDTDGNGEFCNVSIIFEGDCDEYGEEEEEEEEEEEVNEGSSVIIAGQITMIDGGAIKDVSVTLSSSLPEFPKARSSDRNGDYLFTKLVSNYNYEISAEKTDTYINGVSTLDLIGIQQHILGQSDMDNPYKIIAADANRDNQVTAVDILQLRQLILGLSNDLPETKAWTFVDKSQTFIDQQNPWPFTESIVLSDLSINNRNADFIGIKIGDVNLTADVNDISNSEIRSNNTFVLQTDDQKIRTGQLVTVSLRSTNLDKLLGFQFTLEHQGLEFINIVSNVIDISEENIGQFDNKTTFSWFTSNSLSNTNQPFLNLTFKANESLHLEDILSLSSTITEKEAYYKNDSGLSDVVLSIGDQDKTDQFIIGQNKPNPFTGITTIGIQLPNSGNVDLKVFDLTGRVVINTQQEYSKGNHELLVNGKELNQDGIYYYQISFDGIVKTKKMILLK